MGINLWDAVVSSTEHNNTVLELLAGQLPPVRWLPDPAFFGASAVERVQGMLGLIPVIMTA
jgi:hypothetical protein